MGPASGVSDGVVAAVVATTGCVKVAFAFKVAKSVASPA
jgi:hypothetical protein